MELRDKLYYSISELAKYFDVAPSLLRYWEAEFNSIKPRRNGKGTRFYTKKDIDEIRKIHWLVKEQGHTLNGAKEKLKQQKGLHDPKMEVVDKLLTIRQSLENLRNKM